MTDHKPEIRQFLTLSTAHVSPDARRWLELNAGANALQRVDTAHPVAAFMFGWMLWIPPMDSWNETFPFDLRDVFVVAEMHGCPYVLFDADGEIDPSLPTWDWDEGNDTTEGLSEQEIEALKLIHPDDAAAIAELSDEDRDAMAEEMRDKVDRRTNAEVILAGLDPHKPADRRVLLDDESPTFGKAREAAQAAGKAALEGE